MNKGVKNSDLFAFYPAYLSALFESCEYPWEVVLKTKDYIYELISGEIKGYTLYKENVLVGKNVKIYPTATIEGPAIIGEGTEIRPGAFIRGSVITGSNWVLGNSSEFKNCILLNNVQVPHYNYVGDSVL